MKEKHFGLCLTNVQVNDFVACRYDERWWIGIVDKINEDERDAAINFLHPPGPANSFVSPTRADICCIPENDIIMKINSLTTATGRTYFITQRESALISKSFLQLLP